MSYVFGITELLMSPISDETRRICAGQSGLKRMELLLEVFVYDSWCLLAPGILSFPAAIRAGGLKIIEHLPVGSVAAAGLTRMGGAARWSPRAPARWR